MTKQTLFVILLVLGWFSHNGMSEEATATSNPVKSPVVRFDPLISQLIEDLKDATVHIHVDVFRGDLDPEKSEIAEGLHEGYFFKEPAHDVFEKNLQRYPLIVEDENPNEELPDFCDYTGFFSIEPKRASHYYLFELMYGDWIRVTKYNGDREAVASVSGRWVNCELTVYRICEIMRNCLWRNLE